MAKHPETNAVRIQTKKTGEKEHSTPLFLTSSFTYDSAEDMAAAFSDDSLDVNIYSRFSNPSVDEFIEKIASLEGAEDGIATAHDFLKSRRSYYFGVGSIWFHTYYSYKVFAQVGN